MSINDSKDRATLGTFTLADALVQRAVQVGIACAAFARQKAGA
jgi:predicted short-subunit dehydrogenase-like oxidoreductase (DUF2520 family)